MNKAFQTTQWSLVQTAADSSETTCRAALESLCRIYWPPVYAFLRHLGHDATAAEDLTQGFFAELLAKKRLRSARPERGRFRSFLLASVKNFAANAWDHSRALKRGGGRPLVALDACREERIYRPEAQDRTTPDRVFERRWALSVLERTQARLEKEVDGSPAAERLGALKPYLSGRAEGKPYREVASDLGLTEAAVKVAVHRLRQRFRRILREEIAQTLTDPSDVDEELRFLLEAVSA